jgi:hypothetical protein
VPAPPESQARTRAFARIIGPWLIIGPGITVLRASKMAALASEFFKSDLFVWFAGAVAVRRTADHRFSPVLVERGGGNNLAVRHMSP